MVLGVKVEENFLDCRLAKKKNELEELFLIFSAYQLMRTPLEAITILYFTLVGGMNWTYPFYKVGNLDVIKNIY